MIAPTFESLATKYTKPSKIAFAKINVDSLGDISSRYGVRAMPTFKIFHRGAVVDTIQGANPPALTSAIDKAVKLAGPGSTAGGFFSGAGHKLGGAPISSMKSSASRGKTLERPTASGNSWNISPMGLFHTLFRFFALYFISLFSLDPYKAAENSSFNVNNQSKSARTVSGVKAPTAAGPSSNAQKPRIQTLADL